MMNSDEVKELEAEILKYNPSSLLQRIIIMGALPQNKDNIMRLELLFNLTTSLSEDKFQYKAIMPSDLTVILSKLSKIHDWNMDDYSSISLLDYPPIWILGKRYRIFPGLDDHMYESWKYLVRYYFPIKDEFISKFNYNPISIIQNILELQTNLLSIIEKHHSNCDQINNFYFPTVELINEWTKYIKIWNKTINIKFYNQCHVDFGQLNIHQLSEINSEQTFRYFNVGNKFNIIFPHKFYNFLNIKFRDDHKQINEIVKEKIIFNSKYQLLKKLRKFFPKNKIIPDYSIHGAYSYDFAILFDSNKLFIFKILHLDLDDKKFIFENINNDLKNIATKINNGTIASYCNDKNIGNLPHDVEVIPIILFETFEDGIIPNDLCLPFKYVLVDLFMNFLSMLEEIDDFMSFLKFVKKYDIISKQIMSNVPLDVFSYYLQNSPFNIDANFIIPDLWSEFKINKIQQRPDFQARCIESEEDDSWDLDVLGNSLFYAKDFLSGIHAYIFLLPSKKDIWIYTMSETISYNNDEIACIKLFGELIPYRFLNNDIFDNLLHQLSISSDLKIKFSLTSVKMIKEQNIEALKKFIPLITENNPLIIKSFIHKNTLLFYVIYSPKFYLNFLNKDSLKGEKYVIEKFLTEICNYAQITDIDNVISMYMKKLYQNADPKFSSTNTDLPIYALTDIQYPVTMKSDEFKINYLIKEFLINSEILPKTYGVCDTKKILRKVYEFLNSKFIERISNINQSDLLFFLLNCEHAIILDRYSYQKITKSNYISKIENDSIDKSTKKNNEWNELIHVYRYSIEISIKHYSRGSKSFTLEDWLELQAMAKQIINLSSHVSIMHDMFKQSLHISDDYVFNMSSSNIKPIELFLINFNKSLLDDSAFSNYSKYNSINELFNYLNDPFEDEFKINLEKFHQIINIILEYFNTQKSKTKLFTRDELTQLSKTFKISLNDFVNALELLSLSKENMLDNFCPLDVRNRKFRHACKPIIKLSDNNSYLINAASLYNVVRRMSNLILHGYLLYNKNYIISSKLKNCLQNLQCEASANFEKVISNVLKLKTDLVQLNLKESNDLLKNISEELPGEIDSIAIFKKVKIVYIIEAKCIDMNYGPRDIKNEIQKFQESGGFIDKFDIKVKFIEKHLSEILKYYKIYDTDNWKVESYFVTCNLSFFKGLPTKYPFLSLDDLNKKISTF